MQRAVTLGVLIGALCLIGAAGCEDDSPGRPPGSAVIEVRTVFADGDAPAGGPGAGLFASQQVDRVTAKLYAASGDSLAATQLAIEGGVARGTLVVEIEGRTEARLHITMHESTRLLYLGSEPLTLVPNETVSPTVNMVTAPPSGVRGRVENAIEVEVIAGATVTLVGTGRSTTTNAEGEFEIEVDAGAYTLAAEATGFVSSTSNQVTVRDTIFTDAGVIALVPQMAGDQMVIVLSWGEAPRDLDAHITGPIPNSPGSRFHVYYNDKRYPPTDPIVELDRDDTSSYGPETISIRQRSDGVYRYSVHDYSNRGATPAFPSSALSASGARVRVVRGNQEVANVAVPVGQQGTLWRVVEIDGTTGSVEIVNAFEYVQDPGSIQ